MNLFWLLILVLASSFVQYNNFVCIMTHLLRKVLPSANIHGTYYFCLMVFFFTIILFRYIHYSGFQVRGKQMSPSNVMDLLCFFYRGSDVMDKLTCAQGSFYGGSGFRNIIEGRRPSELEVWIFILFFHLFICIYFFYSQMIKDPTKNGEAAYVRKQEQKSLSVIKSNFFSILFIPLIFKFYFLGLLSNFCNVTMRSHNRLFTVWDPFMGTGTTGTAAAVFGTKFIGYDIDKNIVPVCFFFYLFFSYFNFFYSHSWHNNGLSGLTSLKLIQMLLKQLLQLCHKQLLHHLDQLHRHHHLLPLHHLLKNPKELRMMIWRMI